MIKHCLYIVSLLIILTGFSFSNRGENKINEQITFENTSIKFKKRAEGDTIKLVYTFIYRGDDTLTIIPPEVDCTCTTVQLPLEPIIASSSPYSITVLFDTHEKIGYQDRNFILKFSHSTDQILGKQELRFRGVIKASKLTKEKYKSKKK